jgi:hypothetical protein
MSSTSTEIDIMEIDIMEIDEPLDFGPLQPLDEIPPPPMLSRQYAVDVNGNDPTITPQTVFISMGVEGG